MVKNLEIRDYVECSYGSEFSHFHFSFPLYLALFFYKRLMIELFIFDNASNHSLLIYCTNAAITLLQVNRAAQYCMKIEHQLIK